MLHKKMQVTYKSIPAYFPHDDRFLTFTFRTSTFKATYDYNPTKKEVSSMKKEPEYLRCFCCHHVQGSFIKIFYEDHVRYVVPNIFLVCTNKACMMYIPVVLDSIVERPFNRSFHWQQQISA